MKLAYITFLFLFFGSCCSSYDGGYPYNYYDNKYYRKLVLTDKLDTIVKISYKGSDKVFNPMSDSTDLLISENTITTLYIETKNNIDTLVLNIKTSYNYSASTCDNDDVVKNINYNPQVISHTFSGVNILNTQISKYSWGGGYDVYDLINITP
ncbi:MAG: hypothetical protein WCI53_03450 [Bacteroidota bacterium]|jgi:hypothetical protein